MCLLIIRSDVIVRECTGRLHTSECAKFKIQRIKHLFIIIKVQLIIISSVIPYISETNNTSSSLKKKTLKKERGKENEMEKRRRIKKGRKEFVRQKERKRRAKGKEKGRMR